MKSFIYNTTLLLIIIPMLFIPTDVILISSNSGIVLAPSLEERGVVAFENQSLESSDWFSTIKETIQKEEYYITYAEEMKAYQSPNRAQNLRFIFNSDGFTAKPRTTKIPLFDVNDQTLREDDKQYRQIEDWQVQLQVYGYGRGNQINGFSGKELTVHQNKAFIEDQGLKIDYENSADGMRQNFIVKEKPEGSGLLKLKVHTETVLTMRVGPDAVVFINKASNEEMKYNSLKVWDSEKKTLDAHFTKETSNCFAIVVHDENAVYPVTIDPLSTTADWTLLFIQDYSEYGFSVSTAGDVNGDGYSDVIVGAYLYDWQFQDEGRAFVYHGSTGGLPVSADWSARGNQEGAWFGYSVATAGDVNGDGYSDVIVGAPKYEIGESLEGPTKVMVDLISLAKA